MDCLLPHLPSFDPLGTLFARLPPGPRYGISPTLLDLGSSGHPSLRRPLAAFVVTDQEEGV